MCLTALRFAVEYHFGNGDEIKLTTTVHRQLPDGRTIIIFIGWDLKKGDGFRGTKTNN